MSEDEGKKIELSKRVYSLIRDLRVWIPKNDPQQHSQCVDWILNKIVKPINKTLVV